jgi:DNA-binding NtrC family response regulator
MPDKIKLLIVDDEVEFLESIARRLEMRDFDVTTARSGEAAVRMARSVRFDLALLDLKMPGLDGKQVLEILKREHKHLEIIILTGHGSLESAVECTKLGAYSYLPKPYELEKLLEVLKEAYEARLTKKFEDDATQMEKIRDAAVGTSPLGILRALRALDDDRK